MTSKSPRVLSIQSHVVHGYVGNKSSTFPLQLLGFEVDAINSVQFSNHTYYDHVKGQIMNDTELSDIFEGLKSNNLLGKYTHLSSGYIGNDKFLRYIAGIVKTLRATNPNLIYVCDPVMGDDGRLYVPEALVPIYRDEIIPLADIAKPNQFEAELLTGIKLNTQENAWQALDWFHNKGVKTVVLSSTDLGTTSSTLLAFLSHKNVDKLERYKMEVPVLGNGMRFVGTGDLFTAMFYSHFYLTNDLGKALENTSATLHSVLTRTLESLPDEVKNGQRPVRSDERELKLIQSKRDIENPNVEFRVEKVL